MTGDENGKLLNADAICKDTFGGTRIKVGGSTDLVRRRKERTGLHVDTISRREEETQHILDKI